MVGRCLSGLPQSSANVKEGFNDPSGKYPTNVGEADWNREARADGSEEIKDLNCLAKNYDNIGNIYATRNEFEISLKYHKLSLDNFKQLGDKERCVQVLNNIGESGKRCSVVNIDVGLVENCTESMRTGDLSAC